MEVSSDGVNPNVVSGLPPIPWQYAKFDLGQVWQWMTPHFIATITSDGSRYYWRVSTALKNDKKERNMVDTPVRTVTDRAQLKHVRQEEFLPDETDEYVEGEIFANGQNVRFSDAETGVRETVGKSFVDTLGYHWWAGRLAYTFTIATGERVNFEPYLGLRGRIKVFVDDEGTLEEYSGVIQVRNYDVLVETMDGVFKLRPSYIASVESSHTHGLNKAKKTRTVKGFVEPGCSGKPGFMWGTVEHDGPQCGLHER